MLDIDDEKFPPPTPANTAMTSIVLNDTPGSMPAAAGSVVIRNFCPGSKPYSGPRKSTKTDHIVHTENPRCSEKIENARLRRAMRLPVVSQKVVSSGRQSSIQWGRAP